MSLFLDISVNKINNSFGNKISDIITISTDGVVADVLAFTLNLKLCYSVLLFHGIWLDNTRNGRTKNIKSFPRVTLDKYTQGNVSTGHNQVII